MELHFRKASVLDLELLLEWRNDAVTRKNSVSQEPVGRADHESWLKSSLESKDRQLFIGEFAGEPVGTVRFDRHGAEWELSWTVAPSARGKGIGKNLVKAATRLVPEGIIAKVKADNQPSLRIVEQIGFVPVNQVGELIYFQLKK